jgi:hypothetical protein
MKRTITHRALLARINRALQEQSQQVRRSRKDGLDFAKLGLYYAMDRNGVTAHHIDLAEYARKLGLLKLNETLESEDK